MTRRGRETLDLMCRELAARGVALLEADTDGVYFAVPDAWTEADERRVVAEVATLLPPLVQLELDGRFAAMLSHEPKNYALLAYDGALVLHGVAFRSSRAEPFGETFLRRAIGRLLVGDVAGVRDAYLATVRALRRRELPTHDVSSRVRLTKTPARYAAVRDLRRELPYEAMLAGGRTEWSVGDRVRVYRTMNGSGAVAGSGNESAGAGHVDRRDYDVDHYVRLLRDTVRRASGARVHARRLRRRVCRSRPVVALHAGGRIDPGHSHPASGGHHTRHSERSEESSVKPIGRLRRSTVESFIADAANRADPRRGSQSAASASNNSDARSLHASADRLSRTSLLEC